MVPRSNNDIKSQFLVVFSGDLHGIQCSTNWKSLGTTAVAHESQVSNHMMWLLRQRPSKLSDNHMYYSKVCALPVTLQKEFSADFWSVKSTHTY